MGNPFSIPCDPCVNKISQWLDVKVGYIHNLEKNLETLKEKMEDLTVKHEDLSRRLKREEDRGRKRLSEFNLWLTRVVTTKTKVNDLLSDRDAELQKLCLCGFCSKNLISSYRYGKKVFLMIMEVEELKNRDFDKIADQSSEVEERQLQPIIVGQETMLEKAWKHLMEDGVGIMGMYGMGGVGKTTLLTQINNKFSNNKCGFDFVIWIVVSKELHVEKIQDEIAQKVGLDGGELNQKDKSQKADHLFNFLKKKRFVLFLDDIWEKVDLGEIGVPDPRTQKGCKVAFTTRSQDVCAHMGVEDPMEVQCLAEDVAFDLFEKKVGQITLGSDPGIPDLARKVAKECCGLPLALNVIGETMSCKRTIQEWRHAIYVLNSYAAEFSGMDKILGLLKYSYDNLVGEQVKSCLLYCALFPEDDDILIEKLIEYWICEGIIDGSEGIEEAEYMGYEIIGSLVRASLLMEGVDKIKGITCVRMHDVVREMALWIASDLGKQKETFIVRAGVGISEIPQVMNWNVVRRMSLMKNKIHHLAGRHECLELTTLLLQEANLENISSEFFIFMPKLVVLDLSGNEKLSNLPNGISYICSLQYLNVSGTGLHHLPKSLHNLRKLIHLDLEKTSQLKSIAEISSLQSLKVLKLEDSGFRWDLNTVEELEALEHLEILTITIGNTGEDFDQAGRKLEQFWSSHRLMSCTQSLEIKNQKSSGLSLLPLPALMDKLRKFIIEQCSISEIKMGRICSFLSLSEVDISHCKGLRELTFLMFAPNLRILNVWEGNEVEDIINKEKACEVENSGILPFPKLNTLYLADLPKLKNIYWSPLPFPCLEKIRIMGCPNLNKLPLDSKSCKHGLIIKYKEKEWIEGVEWEDEATKTHFLPLCQQI